MSVIVAHMQSITLSRVLRIATYAVAFLIFATLAPFVAAQDQAKRILLIDIPGVGWTGEARPSGWGSALSADKITIYIRHEGPGWDKWSSHTEPNVIVVTLPDQWDEKSTDELLLPIIKQAFAKDKDVHVVIDKNNTLSGHLLPLPQKQEDRWAASVTDYILKHKTAGFLAALAEHSRGTVTNDYITDFTGISYVIVASPRGDQSLEFISRIPSSVKVDIITGIWDAPSWRWSQRLRDIVKKNPNVRIIQLQNFGGWGTTHSREQNIGYAGTWKIITISEETIVQGTLEEILALPGRQKDPTKDAATVIHQPPADARPGSPTVQALPPPFPPGSPQPPPPSAAGVGAPSGSSPPPSPPPPGGVDFVSVDLHYLTELDDNTIGVAFRALPAKDGKGVELVQAGDLAWNSFFTWLALSPDKFWVNLNPNEPNRVVDGELGRTDAGRIMLQADFEMKKTVAKLIHPDSATGKAFWDQLYTYAEEQRRDRLCFSFRQWIVPGNVIVYADADEIYIVDATLDVKLESDYLKLQGADATMAAACPPDVDPALQARSAELFRKIILPELIKQVNTAPEYHEIRSIYHSRIAAEWYKTQHRANARAFASIIGRGNAVDWYSATSWNPQTLFREYVQSVTQGEFNITQQTQTTEGNYIIRRSRTYFYGGVDFTTIALTPIGYSTLVAQKSNVNQEVYDALFNLTGASGGGEVWLGGLYAPARSGGVPLQAPAPTASATSIAPTVAAPTPTAQPGSRVTPVASSGGNVALPCGASAIPVMLFIWGGWSIVRRQSQRT